MTAVAQEDEDAESDFGGSLDSPRLLVAQPPPPQLSSPPRHQGQHQPDYDFTNRFLPPEAAGPPVMTATQYATHRLKEVKKQRQERELLRQQQRGAVGELFGVEQDTLSVRRAKAEAFQKRSQADTVAKATLSHVKVCCPWVPSCCVRFRSVLLPARCCRW